MPPQHTCDGPQLAPVPIGGAHPPQFAGLVIGSTHVPPQQTIPAVHAGVQAVHAGALGATQPPAQHLIEPEHTFPHVPQFATLELVSTHMPEQHDCPLPQTLPQAPQFIGSVRVSKQTLPQHC